MASLLQRGTETAADNQSSMILDMERKLNPVNFNRRFRKTDKYCTLSNAQYWDMLTYIDDDYLTQWEVIKMKELYYWQLQEMSAQAVSHVIAATGIAYMIMGPLVRSSHIGWSLRFPFMVTAGTFLSVQASNWERSSKHFHELMCQPAPHGSYVRRTIKASASCFCPYRLIYELITAFCLGTLPHVVAKGELRSPPKWLLIARNERVRQISGHA